MCCISASHSPLGCRFELHVLHICITFAALPPLRAPCAAYLHHFRCSTAASSSMCCISASHSLLYRHSALHVLHICITFADFHQFKLQIYPKTICSYVSFFCSDFSKSVL
ncbi:putative membrane protein YwzB [Paenibacillus castaneae]|nr:putative membrane protein YwzB [Paenibacillus castaneae]